ncbi:MAG: hypothetical protein Q8M31_20555 [Beijerinckiaceae bacterium]|nr:hypothetical protein [Beijerinckiaceae bacterium]
MSMSRAMKVAGIVRDAGGRVVGRTRLQKIAYLLTVVGLEDGLAFSYKHYGPYSDELANAARMANLFGDVREIEQAASWGGTYSVYSVNVDVSCDLENPRKAFARLASQADAVELELAATAVFLASEGFAEPWKETIRRKPEKADDSRIENAKALLQKLSEVATPRQLPRFA